MARCKTPQEREDRLKQFLPPGSSFAHLDSKPAAVVNGRTVSLPDLLGKQVSDYIRQQRGRLPVVGRQLRGWLRDIRTIEHIERLADAASAKGDDRLAAMLLERAAIICERWDDGDRAAELRRVAEVTLRRHKSSMPVAKPVAVKGPAGSGRDRFEQLQTLARYAGFEVEINPTRVVNLIAGLRQKAQPEGDPIRAYVEQGVGHPHEIVARLCTVAW